jgi:topoisomerase-4 subunit B
MDPNTRRLVQLTLDEEAQTMEMMDMLLAKKRSPDRRQWLEDHGNKAQV